MRRLGLVVLNLFVAACATESNFVAQQSPPKLWAEQTFEEKIQRADVIIITENRPNRDKLRAYVKEILKHRGDRKFDYALGDEYPPLAITPTRGISWGEGALLLFQGSPAKQMEWYPLRNGRLTAFLDEVTPAMVRTMIKSPETMKAVGLRSAFSAPTKGEAEINRITGMSISDPSGMREISESAIRKAAETAGPNPYAHVVKPDPSYRTAVTIPDPTYNSVGTLSINLFTITNSNAPTAVGQLFKAPKGYPYLTRVGFLIGPPPYTKNSNSTNVTLRISKWDGTKPDMQTLAISTPASIVGEGRDLSWVYFYIERLRLDPQFTYVAWLSLIGQGNPMTSAISLRGSSMSIPSRSAKESYPAYQDGHMVMWTQPNTDQSLDPMFQSAWQQESIAVNTTFRMQFEDVPCQFDCEILRNFPP